MFDAKSKSYFDEMVEGLVSMVDLENRGGTELFAKELRDFFAEIDTGEQLEMVLGWSSPWMFRLNRLKQIEEVMKVISSGILLVKLSPVSSGQTETLES